MREVGGRVVIDEDFLRYISERASKRDAVVDMDAVLRVFVTKVMSSPVRSRVYGDLLEAIERAIARWRERKSDLQGLYREMLGIIRRIHEEERRMKELGMTDREFALLRRMESEVGHMEGLVDLVRGLLRELERGGYLFPGWYQKTEARLKVSEVVRKRLLVFMLKSGQRYDRELLGKVTRDLTELLADLGRG